MTYNKGKLPIYTRILITAVVVLLGGCKEKKTALAADFEKGKIMLLPTKRSAPQKQELTIRTLFELNNGKLSITENEYFQYHLGKNIRVVKGQDTLAPELFFYVPLIKETQKEIDVKFLIDNEETNEPVSFIILDSLFNLNKINIELK